jgi:hypothetical protein
MVMITTYSITNDNITDGANGYTYFNKRGDIRFWLQPDVGTSPQNVSERVIYILIPKYERNGETWITLLTPPNSMRRTGGWGAYIM